MLLRRRPAFARLWLSGLVSEVGDWLLLIALPVYVLQLTGSPLVTSTIFLLELCAAVLAGPVAGVVADRWNRRRTLTGASLAQAALLLPLLAVDDRGDLWLVYAVTVVQAVLATVNDPVRQALLPSVVDAGEVTAAAGQLGVGANLARLVGGALGGVLLETSGLAGVVLGDAVTFGVAAALLIGRTALGAAPAPHPSAPGPRQRRAAREWLDGLAVIRAEPRLRGTLLLTALMALAQGMFVVLFVVFVLRRLGGGGTEVGLLRGVQAVGGIAGGLAIGWLARRVSPRWMVAGGLAAYAVGDAAIWNGPALTTALPLYLALFVLVGLPIVATAAGLTTIMLDSTPDRFRGRVASTHTGAFAAVQAVGMLLAGVLVEPIRLLPLLNAQAGIAAVAAVLAVRVLRSPLPPAQQPEGATGPGRPVAPDDPTEDDARPVRPAVVGDERVVALEPPAVPDRTNGPLDDQPVRAGREATDDHVAGADPAAGADQECIAVAEGRHHRRAGHEDPLPRPAR